MKGRPSKVGRTFIGKQMLKIRTDKGLTQKAAAELCGLQTDRWTKLERGYNYPSLRTLQKIAQGLNCDLFVELRPQDIK